VGLTLKAERVVAGGFVNDGFALGHVLRDRVALPPARQTLRVPVAIVGGGMAGLSAAWRLHKRGFRDFVLLEMEPDAGGNSRWGQNEISAYPWAAHYVPIPNARATLVRELFEELGVLKNGVWEERYMCFSPQERLFIHGHWQDGLEPEIGLSSADRGEFQRFETMIGELRASGEFSIPMELGHRRMNQLDRITFQDWAGQNGFRSANLRWYLDYACRDDFGARASKTSAWAGLHYFAAREHEDKGPLTWPEGNGWIARRLIDKLRAWIRPNSGVRSIVKDGTRLRVHAAETEYIAERVIFAAPTFLAPYVLEGAPKNEFVYSPWLTANLTLDRLPKEQRSETAWDNVIFDSPGLGYVNATHMSLRTRQEQSVWTYYRALADGEPAVVRQNLLKADWRTWKDAILDDLARAHPDVRECVSRVDIMRIGHAMARPVPGFLESEVRKRLVEGKGPVYFANSDLSGFSIFEEAQYRGVSAADRVLRDLGR
jgi:glycine/D-amino acid oxidase-like deaminating enzyme